MVEKKHSFAGRRTSREIAPRIAARTIRFVLRCHYLRRLGPIAGEGCRLSVLLLLAVWLLVGKTAEHCQAAVDVASVQRSIDRGITYLRKTQNQRGGWEEYGGQSCGLSALCTLALSECGSFQGRSCHRQWDALLAIVRASRNLLRRAADVGLLPTWAPPAICRGFAETSSGLSATRSEVVRHATESAAGTTAVVVAAAIPPTHNSRCWRSARPRIAASTLIRLCSSAHSNTGFDRQRRWRLVLWQRSKNLRQHDLCRDCIDHHRARPTWRRQFAMPQAIESVAAVVSSRTKIRSKQGLAWLGRNFTLQVNPGGDAMHFLLLPLRT